MPKIARPVPDKDEWVFLAMFRCERCERNVRIAHFDGEMFDRGAYRTLRVCPAGCATTAADAR